MSEKTSVFETLFKIDTTDKIKKKQNLSYLSWASAWAEVKKVYPDATFTVYPQIMDEYGNTRFWHDDGKSGWVDVGVTIEGKEERISLSIMDLRNNAIPAKDITSVSANKAQMRCLVKALALHGLAMHIFEGEDLPEEMSKLKEAQKECYDIFSKKYKISESASKEALALCKAAEMEFNQELTDETAIGDPRSIDDIEILTKLKRQLMAIRK